MKIVILAAGCGTRLGAAYPKALTKLINGQTILEHQIENITSHFDFNDIYIVVGFRKELIMDALPNAAFIYNNEYHVTNTARSLLCALNKFKDTDVMWLNGDVVFDKKVIERMIAYGKSCMVTNRCEVGAEEVKYNVNDEGAIKNISKEIENSVGEALGINLVKRCDVPLLLEGLKKCKKKDYFEKGIEIAIKTGLNIYPVEVGEYFCMEIDFKADLNHVNEHMRRRPK